MGAFKDGNPRDVLNVYVTEIADAICGEDEFNVGEKDRLRTALGRIAQHMKAHKPVSGGAVAYQAASTATTASEVATDLNALIQKLKDAGIMASE